MFSGLFLFSLARYFLCYPLCFCFPNRRVCFWVDFLIGNSVLKYPLIAAHTSFWPALILVLFSLLLHTTSLNAVSTNSTKHRQEVIVARHGAVATDHGSCSRIGSQVLREGGHAVDAAVAAALCLGVVSPASSGIGGGAFMILRLGSGEAQAYDMRETAPLLASEVNLNFFTAYSYISLPIIYLFTSVCFISLLHIVQKFLLSNA